MENSTSPNGAYVIYLRKSRADIEAEARGELETLARHEKILVDLAQRMKIPVSMIYKELVSGETIIARPIMQRLLSEVEQGQWVGVLVMEIERLARGDTIDQGLVLNAFKAGRTKIITPIKTYDPNNEFDEEYFEFGLFMSRREYKTINRRIQRGRIESVKEGKVVSSTPPFGYKRVKIKCDKGYTFEINQEEAAAVKLIFSLYNRGKGMSVIARELDELRVKPRHRDTWSKSTISDILRNPVYIGKIRWGYKKERKQSNITTSNDARKKRIISSDYYYVDGLHPAIIDESTFTEAQVMRVKNTHKKVNNNLSLQNPLSGIVYCKKCGSIMSRLGCNKRNQYDTLRCSNRYCDNVSAPIYLIERQLIKQLSSFLSQFDIRVEQLSNSGQQLEERIKSNSIQTLRGNLENMDRQIDRTHSLLEQGIYSVETFQNRISVLNSQRADIGQAISELENQDNTAAHQHQNKEAFLPKSIKPLDSYYNLNTAKKNMVLRLLVHRVDYIKEQPNKRGSLNRENFKLTIYPTFLKL